MSATLFHTVTYRDAVAAATFLEAIGFDRKAMYPSSDDPAVIDHAQYNWGEHGGLMFGSAGRRPVDDPLATQPGTASCYLVVDSDAEVDAVYAKAIAAGGTSLQEPVDQDYGGRSASVADLEGNHFSIGSYRGE